MKLKPLIIGAVIGAIAGWFMGSQSNSTAANPQGITGSFAAPWQTGNGGKTIIGG